MKPLGGRNYGSIPHLPNSRMGPSDHHCHEGQARIATIKTRDKHDLVIVTEKLDGSNVGIANVDVKIYALTRAGYLANTSPYEQHHLFDSWVKKNENFWLDVIDPGQRLVGEWIAQAHGTIYSKIPETGPFILFDIIDNKDRLPWSAVVYTSENFDISIPKLINHGKPILIEEAMKLQENGDYGADEAEGVVYRVERKGKFDFMVKWVRPDKVDGKYLPEISGSEAIWNWRPE